MKLWYFYITYWLTVTRSGRLVYHILPGMGMSFGLLWLPLVGVAWTVICLFYQWLEDWRIFDKSYLDVRGYKTGFPLGIVLYFLLRPYLPQYSVLSVLLGIG